jgi:hypothetical protein
MSIYLGSEILPGNIYLGDKQLGNLYQGANAIVTSSISLITPASLPNVLYWFTSDRGVTTSGSSITQWTDQISGSLTLELSGSINSPKYNISDPAANNEPSIEFNTGVTKGQGLYKYLASSPFTTASSVTILEAIIPSASANNELQVSSGLVGGGNAQLIMANGQTDFLGNNTFYYSFSNGQSGVGSSDTSIPYGTLIWRAIIYNNISGASGIKGYFNNASSPDINTSIGANQMRTAIALGFGVYSPAGDDYSAGKIVDFAVINGVLSQDELQSYADYITNKFG